jgi:hypothetical protein
MSVNEEKTGWLMKVEFVNPSEVIEKEERFIVYPKKREAAPELSLQAASFVLEAIAVNGDSSPQIRVERREPLEKLLITDYEQFVNEPTYHETDDWRCVRLPSPEANRAKSA